MIPRTPVGRRTIDDASDDASDDAQVLRAAAPSLAGWAAPSGLTRWVLADALTDAVAFDEIDADLRSFFLAVLDAQQRVISLSALAELPGDICY